MPHVSPITCVDHHAESDLLVTGGYDGNVIAWRAGVELWQTHFDDLVNEVRIDSTGTMVAVAAADSYAFVLDATTGAHTAALGPHGDDVNVVRWLPGGTGLVCTMDHLDPTVRVWQRDGQAWTSHVLARHDSGVFGAAVSPDGTRVATAAEDRTARIWDLATGEELHVLAHPGDPETIDWSPDGTVIATGCDDDICRLWSPETGAVVLELKDASAAVRFVRFSADGSRLLVGAYDATMRSYHTDTWTIADEYRLPFQWERAAAVAGDRVVVGSFGAAPVFHPPMHTDPVPPTFGINALAVADGRVVVGRDDGGVVDLATGRHIAQHESIVNTVAVSPNRRLVVSADYRGVLALADLVDGSVVHVPSRGGPINSAVWNADGSVLHTAGYDGRIRTWTADGELLDDWAAHHSPIKSLAWSPADGGTLVAGSSDGTLSAWKGTAERWRAGSDDTVLVNAVAIAQAADVVVSASRDLHVRRWNLADGALLERLPRVHHKSVKGIAVTPDGGHIVSGSYDGTAVSWTRPTTFERDAVGGWSWRVLRLHGKPGVPAVAVTERNLFTAGWDATVGQWSLDGRLVTRYHAAG